MDTNPDSNGPNRFLKTLLGVALFAVAAGLAPQAVEAQGPPELLSACYIPGTGTMYLVDQSGLPDACIREDHTLLQWNQQGLIGAQGALGAPGLMCWDTDGDGVPDPAEDRDGNNVYDSDDCRGDEGAPGLPGSQGAAGADGSNGLPGPQGPQGAPGQDGGDGAAGADGSDGLPGPQGPQGEQGPQGDLGQDGSDGAPGVDGLDGAGPTG
jgi:hypothetical protein